MNRKCHIYNKVWTLAVAAMLVSLPATAKKHQPEPAAAQQSTVQMPPMQLQPVADSIQAVSPVDTAAVLTHEDSLALHKTLKKAHKERQKRDWTTWKPDPKRAMWLAIVLPGAGQIYNRKYWKLPIVYGGFLGCIYAMRWNNQMYQDYAKAYQDISDNDPNTQSYNEFLHLGVTITEANKSRYTQIFKSRKDTYRRYRDLSFFCMLGVYALSIIDAYVDASLSKFDISDDLSLRISPAVIDGKIRNAATSTATYDNVSTSAVGVAGSLTF